MKNNKPPINNKSSNVTQKESPSVENDFSTSGEIPKILYN